MINQKFMKHREPAGSQLLGHDLTPKKLLDQRRIFYIRYFRKGADFLTYNIITYESELGDGPTNLALFKLGSAEQLTCQVHECAARKQTSRVRPISFVLLSHRAETGCPLLGTKSAVRQLVRKRL
jgi:hypothetical protein